jgi:hypothetical protein
MTNLNQIEMLYHQINNTDSRNKALHKNYDCLNNTNKNKRLIYKCNKIFKLQMILVILFFCSFTCLIKYANTQETNFYYTDENGNLL